MAIIGELLLSLRTKRNKNRLKKMYYWGTRPWIIYLLIGVASLVGALFIENTIISAIVGVFGASALWGIGELFQQQKRVEKGWFPKNPKRRY